MPSGRNIRAGGAYVDLYTEDKRLVRGLAMAQRRLQAFASGATAIGKKLMTASAAVLGPLTLSVRHFMRAGDALDKMSHRVGASVEFLSALGHAAQIGGTDISAMEVGIRRMQRTALDATRGLSTATDAFDALGMSVLDSEGKLKSTEQLFMEAAAALSQLDNNTRKAALSTMIFGRAGTSLLPMLSKGKEGLLAVMEEAKRLGVVIGTDQARAAAAFTDVWTRLVSVLKMVVFEVGSALVPKLSELVPKIQETAQGVRAWIRENGEAILNTAKLVAKIALVGAGLVALGGVLNATGVIFGTLAVAVKGLYTALTFLAAHPVVAALVGITVAAIAAAKAIDILSDSTVKLNREMRKAHEEGDKIAAQDLAKIDRLKQLAKKQSLTNSETEEAHRLIRQLSNAYGNTEISINSVTGALERATHALVGWTREIQQKAIADLASDMEETARNARKLTEQMTDITWLGSAWRMVTLRDPGGKIEGQVTAIKAEWAEWQKLRDELDRRRGGDFGGITGGAAVGTPDFDLQQSKGNRVLDFEKNLARTIAELRIQAAKKGLDEELALLKLRYHEEMMMAEQLGNWRATQAARAAVREKHALEESEIRERHARETKQRQDAINERLKARRRDRREEVEAQRQDLQYQNASLKIQATKKGLARDLAMLDLEQKRALAQGGDPALIAEQFAWKKVLAKQRHELAAADPATSVRGTFSAFGARGLASAGPLDRIAKTNQQIADGVVKLVKKATPLAFT